jgi:hypothetical protein
VSLHVKGLAAFTLTSRVSGGEPAGDSAQPPNVAWALQAFADKEGGWSEGACEGPAQLNCQPRSNPTNPWSIPSQLGAGLHHETPVGDRSVHHA